jgi:NAD(P)-dependent dehydrogenase (short-subunit alcohol dehydrogenase family)
MNAQKGAKSTMPEQPLSGKLALVTGAGNGTGRAIANELARQGAGVVLHNFTDAPNLEALNATVDAIVANGGRAALVLGNLAQVADCYRIVDEAATFLGGLDILVNHAEIAEAKALSDVSPADFEQVLNTNMRGTFFVTQQAVRWMEERGGGSIVNMGSVISFAGIPNHSLYAVTKGAIVGFTRQLAIELMPNHIRVNAVAPGYISEVEISEVKINEVKINEVEADSYAPAQNSWGRMGKPEDVARLVAFLISPAAEFINGQMHYVDGGLTSRVALYPPLVNTQELGQ